MAERIILDKEDNGGRWLITYAADPQLVFRLRIAVGGPADWYSFFAEIQASGEVPVALAQFDIAPIELWTADLARYEPTETPVWDPQDEPDFLKIPVKHRETFAQLVRLWGRVAGTVVPASAWLTVH
jgi:hypothetical protein